MKERVLAFARQEIHRTGYRFTMNELAKQLGMSTKTIYEWYPSKDALIDDIVQCAIDELKIKEAELAADVTLHPLQKLKKALVLIPQDFQLFDLRRLNELQRYYPEIWKKVDQLITEQWDGVLRIINEGISTGTMRPFHSDLFIELYIGGLYRLMEQSSKGKMNKTLGEALDEMVDILLNGIVK
ncbi:UNVERIFIED_CONTAM: AcrR family transcriptional regulator [Brevibacillus sp. OAP136]